MRLPGTKKRTEVTPRIAAPLLRDEALRATDPDALQTAHYAALLRDAILSNRAPLSFGLFGRWGRGKSSVLERLHAEFRDGTKEHPLLKQRLLSVLFDAWKYEGDTLRRQLLMSVAAALDEADGGNTHVARLSKH